MQWQRLPGLASRAAAAPGAARPSRVARPLPRSLARASAVCALLSGAFVGSAQALDFGPFTLTGFAKAEWVRGTDQCPDCAVFPEENKQRQWADALRYGSAYGTR